MEKYTEAKSCISGADDLFKFRVTEIMLISTEYDAYVLEEDGQLAEKIYHQFSDLSLPYIPRIHWVASSEEAFETLKKIPIHLVISMSRANDMSSFDFERAIHEVYPEIPIVMLSYERLTPDVIGRIRENTCINRVFHWSGDNKVLLAIIKYVEDQQNFAADSKLGVQAILLVEDSPVYYSQILPIIYTEILSQTRYLVLHAMNVKHGLLRVRLRPKILLAETYEEAIKIIESYRYNLLGIISDVRFPKGGCLNKVAGFELAQQVKGMINDLPFLLQSEDEENEKIALARKIDFLSKTSPSLLHNLRSYILESYGFGPFVFKYPDGRVIEEANDITALEKIVRDLPEESLQYHAANNDFSRWFRARAEFEVAEKLRFLDAAKIDSSSDMRNYILGVLTAYFKKYQTGSILSFEGLAKKDMENAFIKLGKGSLGGKARGVAFMNAMISKAHMADKYEDMKVKVPRSFVVGSEVFEKFIEQNDLYSFISHGPSEAELAKKFVESELPEEIKDNLRVLTLYIKCPLAVRSSSILEDSRILPFAGIYKTYVVPNSNDNNEVCFKQLSDAVKLVYASVFYEAPVRYAQNADIRIEEEKMAVLIQELVGEYYGEHFYPAISGVAQSYNFYPYYPIKPEDGTVSLALGFGKTIVEGERTFRFSPVYPKLNPLVSSPQEQMSKAQNLFYSVNLKKTANLTLQADEDYVYEKMPVSQAYKDGALEYIGSTYSAENDCIYDNVNHTGLKLITFAPILKYNRLPLTKIIQDLMLMGKKAFGSDVEIEFAINIPKDKNKPAEFNFLQIRPIVIGKEAHQVNLEETTDTWCFSKQTIGNGYYDDIKDIIYVDPENFDLKESMQIAREIGTLNKILAQEGRRCILIGFGRIGTADRWLGIPLTWEQMSQSLIIVEVERRELRPEPSLGSHFFHNLTATGMGYFHVPFAGDHGTIDWQWLISQPVLQQTKYVKLIRREEAFKVKIDGRNFQGVIYK
ncbi:MAG: PEP/pyruvate-binding domain-containing protein [Acidaminococcaceae bacterium]